MKRVHILGKEASKIKNLKEKLEKRGFEYVDENPELVVCYGGDGMFLISERVFPGVEKLLIKDSLICNMGHDLSIEEVIDLYEKGSYDVKEIKKLKATFKGRFETRELVGVNDIVIRNSLPTEAIRFKVSCCDNEIDSSEVLIGDGVVVATSYGSSKGAYFHSICRKGFDRGIGVAFNNVSEEKDCIILDENNEISIEIVRGPAVLVADNNRDFINLENGDKVFIRQIGDVARRVVLKKDKEEK